MFIMKWFSIYCVDKYARKPPNVIEFIKKNWFIIHSKIKFSSEFDREKSEVAQKS